MIEVKTPPTVLDLFGVDPNAEIVPGNKMLAVQQLKPIKMKDKLGRNRLVLRLEEVFGFLPETLIIDKVFGSTSTIQISAVVPDDKKV